MGFRKTHLAVLGVCNTEHLPYQRFGQRRVSSSRKFTLTQTRFRLRTEHEYLLAHITSRKLEDPRGNLFNLSLITV